MSKPVSTQRTMPNFSSLVAAISQAHLSLADQAARAVNVSLTLRNWLVGAYIQEYEQRGADRAQYGEALLDRLSQALAEQGAVRYHPRELRRCRTFYLAYPEIRGTLSPESVGLMNFVAPPLPAGDSAIDARLPIRGTLPPELAIPPQRLVQSLSFSHFAELLAIEDPLKRRFYEIECLRGNWTVRELKRQMGSLYFERSGLSTDKNKLAAYVQMKAEQSAPVLNVRDPYVFEFLGLKPQEVMYESDVEDAILDNLQQFLLEMGHGFCFEARQKRILIGDEHYFVDLVFYHRILKCHVLVELKLAEFSHENIGQLNTYVSWYRKHMTLEGDNPPIGILLCTHKKHSLAEFALAGMDNQLFVSKYQLELPKREEIERFLTEKLREAGADDE
ncbi:MAG: PDDEXK nuclease domain-containing protein [Rhodocyclaceae bacterium]|nr:PDDEXK nuclease domain-containing protein [Rhodocyclaceae bacterium]